MKLSSWNIPLILRRMLELMLVLSPIFMITLPFLFGADTLSDILTGRAQNQWITLMFIEICGVFCWFILLMLQKMLKTVLESSPFEYKNVKYLKYISYFCAAAAVVLIVKTFVDFSILTPVVAIIALLSSLFCQTLAAVFDKAIRLKDENDLTI